MEMRFKNYIDKKYNLYENADRDFYDSLTRHDKIKELRKLRDPMYKQRLAVVENAHKL